ncbi:fibulin-1-like [Protopterus annectens]|uniref:fibulin-1-like n=1 Tax=Protopterus annectens TaxID=7888 RepID=UPI001CF9384C|nr:fibulin-1-like [Protopterus annectens]
MSGFAELEEGRSPEKNSQVQHGKLDYQVYFKDAASISLGSFALFREVFLEVWGQTSSVCEWLLHSVEIGVVKIVCNDCEHVTDNLLTPSSYTYKGTGFFLGRNMDPLTGSSVPPPDVPKKTKTVSQTLKTSLAQSVPQPQLDFSIIADTANLTSRKFKERAAGAHKGHSICKSSLLLTWLVCFVVLNLYIVFFFLDIDECALPTGGHICAYRCHNVPGSFRCSCPSSGYTLAPNGRSCQDIDECVTATHNCSGTETCFNIQGSFRCLAFECPKNYQKSGDTRCDRLPCNENTECQSLPLRITYYYLTFPTNIQVPSNIFRMGPSNSIPGDTIALSITSGNEEGYFSAQTLNNYTGVVTAQQQFSEPKDFILTIEMKLIRYGIVTTFESELYVFVTPEL